MKNLPFLRVASVRIRDGRNYYQLARQDKRFRATTIELSRDTEKVQPWCIEVGLFAFLSLRYVEGSEHTCKVFLAVVGGEL